MTRVWISVLVAAIVGVSGCSSSGGRKKNLPAPIPLVAGEEKAKQASDDTTRDERHAPLIQKEMNALFFRDKKESPGGLNAFSPERIAVLETDIENATGPGLKYFRENRDYFDRIEDQGGGFRVVANGKRLLPFLKTKTGRRKLFQMDLVRVRELVANPCFSALEDCGEYASDGEENTALLDEWSRKYPDAEFRSDRHAVIGKYLKSLKLYEAKFVKRGKGTTAKAKTARAAAELVGTHVKGIESLLKD